MVRCGASLTVARFCEKHSFPRGMAQLVETVVRNEKSPCNLMKSAQGLQFGLQPCGVASNPRNSISHYLLLIVCPHERGQKNLGFPAIIFWKGAILKIQPLNRVKNVREGYYSLVLRRGLVSRLYLRDRELGVPTTVLNDRIVEESLKIATTITFSLKESRRRDSNS